MSARAAEFVLPSRTPLSSGNSVRATGDGTEKKTMDRNETINQQRDVLVCIYSRFWSKTEGVVNCWHHNAIAICPFAAIALVENLLGPK